LGSSGTPRLMTAEIPGSGAQSKAIPGFTPHQLI
jgi:hypothetical protein